LREWSDAVVFAVIVATFIRWSAVAGVRDSDTFHGKFTACRRFPVCEQISLRTTDAEDTLADTAYAPENMGNGNPVLRVMGFSFLLSGFRGSPASRKRCRSVYVPPKKLNGDIDYPVDLKNNYVKRCVAVAGDTLRIENREIRVNNQMLPHPPNMKFSYLVTARDEINKRNLRKMGLDSDDYVISDDFR